MSDRDRINVAVRALVVRLGCLDAVAETLNAATGSHLSKGTLSKRMSGQLDWPLADILALEDAVGAWPVSAMIARRMEGRGGEHALSLIARAGRIAKETGEAVAALLDDSGTDVARARMAQELSEAIEELVAARNAVEGRG